MDDHFDSNTEMEVGEDEIALFSSLKNRKGVECRVRNHSDTDMNDEDIYIHGNDNMSDSFYC